MNQKINTWNTICHSLRCKTNISLHVGRPIALLYVKWIDPHNATLQKIINIYLMETHQKSYKLSFNHEDDDNTFD
jgi:hypothetical protein